MCEESITVLRNFKVRNKLNNHLNVSIKDFSQPLVGYQANLLEEQDFEDGIEWLGYKKRLEYVEQTLFDYQHSTTDQERSASKKELVESINAVYRYLKTVAHIQPIVGQTVDAKYLHDSCTQKMINVHDFSIKICTSTLYSIQQAVEDCIYCRLKGKRIPRIHSPITQSVNDIDVDFTTTPVTVYVIYAPIKCEKDFHNISCVRASVYDTSNEKQIIHVA